MNLNDFAVFVFNDPFTLDIIGVLKPHFTSGSQPEEFAGRILHKIFALDIDFPRKWDLPCPGVLVFRIIFSVKHLDLSLWVIVNNNLNRIEDCHDPRGATVQIIADRVFELPHLNEIIRL